MLTNGSIEEASRKGWILKCPQCSLPIRYTVLNVDAGRDVYLYSDRSSDFVLRKEDRLTASEIDWSDRDEALRKLEKLYTELEHVLPAAPDGGRFRLWSNVRCPHCKYELPYNAGIQDLKLRLTESKVIWVEGATVFRGGNRPSDKLNIVRIDGSSN